MNPSDHPNHSEKAASAQKSGQATVQYSPRERFNRYLLFTFSLFVNGAGVAFVTAAGIGTTPITSPVLVVSHSTGVTLGSATFVFNLLLIALQIPCLGLRRSKKMWTQLMLQVPVCFAFAASIDAVMLLLHLLLPEQPPYFLRLMLVAAGVSVLASGIALEVTANVCMVPGEYFVKVFHPLVRRTFGEVKTFFDIFLVACAVIFSFVLPGVEPCFGVREGTLIAALFTGPLVQVLLPKFAALNAVLGTAKPQDQENAP